MTTLIFEESWDSEWRQPIRRADIQSFKGAALTHSMKSLGPSSSWFVIQVVPRCEVKASVLLEFKGYQCYVPMYVVCRKWSDRIKKLSMPLFPGYVFCCFEGVPTGRVIETPSVIRIVSFGGKPSIIGDDEMDAIQAIVDNGNNPQPCPYLKIGHHIKVNTGPLCGIAGILVRFKNHHRLVISVEAIMKSVSIEVDATDVIDQNMQMGSHIGLSDSGRIERTLSTSSE